MPAFHDTQELYGVLDALFTKLVDNKVVDKLAGPDGFVLRFRYSEPEGQVTLDLRQVPIQWQFGATELEPDLEMIQSADVAHAFWSGRLNVPGAIARRQVVARGPVGKALKLLPAIKPAFPLYREVLSELGHGGLLEQEKSAGTLQELGRMWRRASRTVSREVHARLRPISGVTHLGRRRPTAASIDWEALRDTRLGILEPGSATASPQAARATVEVPTEPAALARVMFRRMHTIRAFEERLAAAYASGEVPTEAIHLSVGQEAVAVGVCFALRADDQIATTHRGHGHMLAKGADLDGMTAEMFGKLTGLCKGKGGSMHVTDSAVGALGANGIVGASALIATGAAHGNRMAKTDRVAVAFMGDGATNQGMFHEAANFAAVFDLPVVFVIENNLYGEFTSLADHARVERLSDRAAAYGMPGETVDGNDVRAVYEAASRAVQRARAGDGPTILECLTYRWHGHMEGETAKYRSDEEKAAWRARCPIDALRAAMLRDEVLDAASADADADTARAEVEASFERAQRAPEPGLDELTRDTFAPEPREVLMPGPLQPAGTREITCSQALYEAISEELARDPSVYLLGEDVCAGGYFEVTTGLGEVFGRERVIDTPISEYAIVGSAVGAAMVGARPIAEILFSDFLTTCMDPLVNQAAKLRFMSGGQYTLPMVVRTPGGAGLGMAAQHSQSLEALLTGVPGLIVVAPATPYDAKGLLKAAIRSNNPVVFFENKLLYTATGPVPEGDYLVPLGVADVKRAGTDVTLVSVGAALDKALAAAAQLAADDHIEVEVVDVRTLVPLDIATILRSVLETGRLVTVEDGSLCHGFGSELLARVSELAWGALTAAPRRIAALDVPLAYNTRLENAALPDAQSIVTAVREMVG